MYRTSSPSGYPMAIDSTVPRPRPSPATAAVKRALK